MKCNRCGSVMVYDKIYGSEEHFWAWKCIYCGEIFDQVILDNRKDTNVRTRRSRNGNSNSMTLIQKNSHNPSY